jgi:hypothetical protein
MRGNAGEDDREAGWVGFFIAKGRKGENAKFGGIEQIGGDW